MNNGNEQILNLPISIFDMPDVLTTESERAAYLQGFSAALYSAFACVQDDGQRIMHEAAVTGTVPHPVAVITLTLQQLKKFMLDINAMQQALEASGVDGLKSMLKLLSTPSLTGQDGKKIIQ